MSKVSGGVNVSEATRYQRLREHLAYLGMTAAAEHLAAALDRSLKEHLFATQVLEEVLAIQVEETKGPPHPRSAALCALPDLQDAHRLRPR